MPASQPLADDRRLPVALFIHLEMVGDTRRPRPFSVRQLDGDRPFSVASLELLGPPASVPSGPQAGQEALREECEHVEHRGFAAAVRANEHRHRRQLRDLNVLQSTEVPHLQPFDSRKRGDLRCRSVHLAMIGFEHCRHSASRRRVPVDCAALEKQLASRTMAGSIWVDRGAQPP